MSILRLHWSLSSSSLFLAAAKSHMCVSGHKWRFPNVFSNISAFQMMNFILSLCVTLKNPSPRAFSFSGFGEDIGIRGLYLFGHHHIFFCLHFISFMPSPFFLSLHFAVIEEALTVARLHIYIRVQTVNSFFSGEAERSCRNGDHMLTECMI